MYSVGVTLLQMAFPNLRTDNALIAFNKKLEASNYDLNAWRSSPEVQGRCGLSFSSACAPAAVQPPSARGFPGWARMLAFGRALRSWTWTGARAGTSCAR